LIHFYKRVVIDWLLVLVYMSPVLQSCNNLRTPSSPSN